MLIEYKRTQRAKEWGGGVKEHNIQELCDYIMWSIICAVDIPERKEKKNLF